MLSFGVNLQVNATDADSGLLGQVRYSIKSVTNNGQNKFVIDTVTGEVKTDGPINAGESFVIVTEACDRAPLANRR